MTSTTEADPGTPDVSITSGETITGDDSGEPDDLDELAPSGGEDENGESAENPDGIAGAAGTSMVMAAADAPATYWNTAAVGAVTGTD